MADVQETGEQPEVDFSRLDPETAEDIRSRFYEEDWQEIIEFEIKQREISLMSRQILEACGGDLIEARQIALANNIEFDVFCVPINHHFVEKPVPWWKNKDRDLYRLRTDDKTTWEIIGSQAEM